MNTITALVVQYQEPGWTEATLAALQDTPVPLDIRLVDRAGIFGFSDVFNIAMAAVRSDYVWFLTNVTFPPHMLVALLDTLIANPRAAAIHPAFNSDHPHLKPHPGGAPTNVPFVEWTAPLVRRAAWSDVGLLDPDMPYWGMDLDWSYRARQRGWSLMAHYTYTLGHDYLRFTPDRFSVTAERKLMRARFDGTTELRLVEKYGSDWRVKLWPDTNAKSAYEPPQRMTDAERMRFMYGTWR